MTLRKLPLPTSPDEPQSHHPSPAPAPEPPKYESTTHAPSSAAEEGLVTHPPSGLPTTPPETATKSFWLRDPHPDLLGHRGTEELPREADVVVVGSGITGVFAARFLLEGEGEGKGEDESGERVGGDDEGEGKRVVMLEAREACWGATGRNGGHCQPLVYGANPAVAAFELEVFNFLQKLVKDENIDCDWITLAGGVHAFLSKPMFQAAAAAAEQLSRTHPELADNLEIVGPSPSLAALRIPTAQGAIVQKKAASLWPYKLVTALLARLVAAYPPPRFNLQTNTPVTSLSRVADVDGGGDGGRWVLTTPRGSIVARQVLLATNGYTSHLLPAMADLIVPVRGQVAALVPPREPEDEEGKGVVGLGYSYVFAADPEAEEELMREYSAPTSGDGNGTTAAAAPRDDYLIQRPLPTGGEFIFGGGRRFERDLGVGEWRDDEVEDNVARYLRRNLSPPLDISSSSSSSSSSSIGAPGTTVGDQPQQQQQQQLELKATHEWTGIMGYSRDGHAWVGPVPESLGGGEGLFVCAGYTGHGMPAAALSARAVVRGMRKGWKGGERVGQAEEEERKGLPKEFVLNEERVRRAREMPRLTGGWEATNFADIIGV
ncbi:hypothetical protein VTJ04DRAFT_9892 [Mycothermus thermophilus]|uniref:uncharacterized protein n=1 Tax=Humicola insolens TaxID=85995 RepID=UPI003744A527